MNCNDNFVKSCNDQSAKRWIALAFCVIFIAGSLLSSVYIFTNIDHEHDHNDLEDSCSICVHLAAAENLLKQISAALAATTLIFGCFSIIRYISKISDFRRGSLTLIFLKVRLNS